MGPPSRGVSDTFTAEKHLGESVRQPRRAAAGALVAGVLAIGPLRADALIDVIDAESNKKMREMIKAEELKANAAWNAKLAQAGGKMMTESEREVADAAYKEQFRQMFTSFAKDETPMEQRIQLINDMKAIILKNQILPPDIRDKDIARGFTQVRENIGCVKGACKDLMKAQDSLFEAIVQVQDIGS